MPPPMPRPIPPRASLDPAKTYAIKIDPVDAFDGPGAAKVTIVDTYDYACPYCDKTRPTMEALKQKYGKELRIVYKPFVVHMATAMAASIGACAANRQQKFAEVDAALWANYKLQKLDKDAADGTHCWKSVEGCPLVTEAAKAAKLDMVKFTRDFTNCETYVKTTMGELQTFDVVAIPTFFINGRVLLGAQPQASFEALIDEEMKKAGDAIAAGTKAADYYQKMVVGKGAPGSHPRPANPCGGGM